MNRLLEPPDLGFPTLPSIGPRRGSTSIENGSTASGLAGRKKATKKDREGGAPVDEPVRWVTKNGLTVLVQEDHSAPVVALQMWVNVGSADELETEAGLAHVHEHMLFKGTALRGVGEIAKQVEAAGGDINAYTSKDTTVYHIVLASRFFDTALDILADAIQRSAFDADELAKEREVVLEEYRRGEDQPERKIYDLLFEVAYRVHPYRRPTIGDPKVIESLTRDSVLSFFHKWYVPNNMTLVVAGDVRPDEIRSRIEETFRDFEARPTPERPRLPEPENGGPRIRVERGPFKKTFLYMGYLIPGIRSPELHTLDVLASLLGEGDSSRLYRTVKARKKLVHSIHAYAMTPKDTGLLTFGAELDPERIEEATTAILEEVAAIQAFLVPAEEIAKTKRVIESDFVYSKETAQGRARTLGFYEVLAGDYRFDLRYLEELAKVSAENVSTTARKMLRLENLSFVVLMPDAAPSTFDAAAARGLVEKAEARAVALLAPPSPSPKGEMYEERFANGIRLLVKEDHSVPVFSLDAVFLGGSRFETVEKSGLFNLLAGMVTKGTEEKSAQEIARVIDGLACSLDGFSGRNSFGLRGHFLAKDLDPALDLFSEILTEPSFPRDEIEKEREDILHALKTREDDLATIAFNLFREKLYGGHPVGIDLLGTEPSVRSIAREDLEAGYRRFGVPGNLVLVLVGDVDTVETVRKLRYYLGDWAAPAFVEPASPPIVAPTRPQSVFRSKTDKMQAHLIVGFPGTRVTDPDRFPLDVLSAVLGGQGGRLFLELRDKQSLAYSVFAFSRDGLEPGYVGAYIGCAPEKGIAGYEGIWRELVRLREEPVEAEEIERAKSYLAGSFEIGLQSTSSRAEGFALYERYGLGWRNYLAYPERIMAVTAADLQAVARKYLTPDRVTIAVVGPEDIAAKVLSNR